MEEVEKKTVSSERFDWLEAKTLEALRNLSSSESATVPGTV